MPDRVDLIVGIDPGQACGVASLAPRDKRAAPLGQLLDTQTWPLTDFSGRLRRHLERHGYDLEGACDHVLFAVERPVWFALQKQRATGYGDACLAFGQVLGVLEAFDQHHVEYDPNAWRRAINAPPTCKKAVAHARARLLIGGDLGRNQHERDASCIAAAASKDHAL